MKLSRRKSLEINISALPKIKTHLILTTRASKVVDAEFARSRILKRKSIQLFSEYQSKPTLELVDDHMLECRLKDSTDQYSDFRKLINPMKQYIDSLCPFISSKTRVVEDRLFAAIPKNDYSAYKLETMKTLKKSGLRLQKAKEIIQKARQLSFKNIY